MDIHIKWLSDECDCDTCGTSYAEGASVLIDGREVLEFTPVAHCFGGTNYSAEDVYKSILLYLDCNLSEEYT